MSSRCKYYQGKVFGFIICEKHGKISCGMCGVCPDKKEQRIKYNNVKTEIDGVVYDSKKESKRGMELIMLQKAGVIKNLKRQVRFQIVPKTETERARFYCADFVYEENGKTVIEDSKSAATAKDKVFRLKWALMKWQYPDYVYRIT